MRDQLIVKLKDLLLVYDVANNNDYIPNQSDIDLHEIFTEQIDTHDEEHRKRLTILFEKYEGCSPNNIREEIFILINKL